MILLTLRTDKPESELGLYDDEKQIAYESWQAHRELAETIHLKIDELLQGQDRSMNDLGGIIAYEGPGSFTGLRIGLSVANALSYALQIPIVGSQGDDWITNGRSKLKSGEHTLAVQPHYGAPVHITQPKH